MWNQAKENMKEQQKTQMAGNLIQQSNDAIRPATTIDGFQHMHAFFLTQWGTVINYKKANKSGIMTEHMSK